VRSAHIADYKRKEVANKKQTSVLPQVPVKQERTPTNTNPPPIHTLSSKLFTTRENASKDFKTELWEEAMEHHIADLQQYTPSVYETTLAIDVIYDKLNVMFDDEELDDVEEKKKKSHLILMQAVKVSSQNEIDEIKKNYITMCENALEQLKMRGSNWSLKRGVRATTKFYRTPKNQRGSAYIKNENWKQQGRINIHNEDDECFKWCILYHQSPKTKHCDRLSILKKVTNKLQHGWTKLSISN